MRRPCYSKHVIHENAAERYLNGDGIERLVFEFIEKRIDRVVDLTFRTYSNAVSRVRKAIKHGRPWESELEDILCGIDVQMNRRESARVATARVMTDSQFDADKNLTRRFEEFHRLTGLSYPSFDRWVKKWRAEHLIGSREVRSDNPDAGEVAKEDGQNPPLLWAAFRSPDHREPMFWAWAPSVADACEQSGDRDYRPWDEEIPEGAYVEGLAPPGFALAGEAARVRAGQIPPHREFREPPKGNRSQTAEGKPEASEEGSGAISDPVVEPDPDDGACDDDRVEGSTIAGKRDMPRKQNPTVRSEHFLGKPGPVGKTFGVLSEGRGDQPIPIIFAQDEASAEGYRLEHYKRLTTRLVPWPGDLPEPTNPWLRKMLVKDIRSKTTRRD